MGELRMGVIVRQEYVCDFCGKGIGDGDALVGRVSLRKAGARGLGRNFELALHDKCSEKFTRHAAPTIAHRKAEPKA
jgi:hypothetical protein